MNITEILAIFLCRMWLHAKRVAYHDDRYGEYGTTCPCCGYWWAWNLDGTMAQPSNNQGCPCGYSTWSKPEATSPEAIAKAMRDLEAEVKANHRCTFAPEGRPDQ